VRPERCVHCPQVVDGRGMLSVLLQQVSSMPNDWGGCAPRISRTDLHTVQAVGTEEVLLTCPIKYPRTIPQGTIVAQSRISNMDTQALRCLRASYTCTTIGITTIVQRAYSRIGSIEWDQRRSEDNECVV
jgi:hypothetical protein